MQKFGDGPGGVGDPMSPGLLDSEQAGECEELLTGLEQRPLQGVCVSLNVENQVEEINVEMPSEVELELRYYFSEQTTNLSNILLPR